MISKSGQDSASILLVDDELVILKVLSRELRAENFLVTAISSGKEAINALQNTPYGIVICFDSK
jgi:CheY-like chemotaxis protein